MIPPKTILVPVDFSETSELALVYAKEFARPFEAVLHLLHVVSDADVSPGTEAFWGFSEEKVQNQWIEEATTRLRGLLSDQERTVFGVRIAVEIGAPFVEIIRYARSHEVDLIMMGTHGRGAVKHLLMGSVAEQVVRQAPCPVMTVRHPKHHFEEP
jgi:nucleotide-binding universal stress UspA family protein